MRRRQNGIDDGRNGRIGRNFAGLLGDTINGFRSRCEASLPGTGERVCRSCIALGCGDARTHCKAGCLGCAGQGLGGR